MGKDIKQLKLPVGCPLCGEAIEITRIKCSGCNSEINGSFSAGGLTALPVEYQKFITVFLRQRGNIKQVEKERGISYPTINKMLDSDFEATSKLVLHRVKCNYSDHIPV